MSMIPLENGGYPTEATVKFPIHQEGSTSMDLLPVASALNIWLHRLQQVTDTFTRSLYVYGGRRIEAAAKIATPGIIGPLRSEFPMPDGSAVNIAVSPESLTRRRLQATRHVGSLSLEMQDSFYSEEVPFTDGR